MTLAEEINSLWSRTAPSGDYAQKIMSVSQRGYLAWSLTTATGYGVAIPCTADVNVNEEFANVQLLNATLTLGSDRRKALLLISKDTALRSAFAALCAEFVEPGAEGADRRALSADPTTWWRKWSTLLGNKDIDERVYDVLGELCTLKALSLKGRPAVWQGPNMSSYDISCADAFYEVKSTVVRDRKEIVIHSQFQLNPPTGTLSIAFCQFELAETGISINSLINDMAFLGIDQMELDDKLTRLGYPEGRTARNRQYLLHHLLFYRVDSSFPRVTEDMFPGGVLPKGVSKLSYSVSLDGLTPYADLAELAKRQMSERGADVVL